MARVAIPEGQGEETARLWSLHPEMAKGPFEFATAVYSNSKLPDRVREFARMRIAQINECPI